MKSLLIQVVALLIGFLLASFLLPIIFAMSDAGVRAGEKVAEKIKTYLTPL